MDELLPEFMEGSLLSERSVGNSFRFHHSDHPYYLYHCKTLSKTRKELQNCLSKNGQLQAMTYEKALDCFYKLLVLRVNEHFNVVCGAELIEGLRAEQFRSTTFREELAARFPKGSSLSDETIEIFVRFVNKQIEDIFEAICGERVPYFPDPDTYFTEDNYVQL